MRNGSALVVLVALWAAAVNLIGTASAQWVPPPTPRPRPTYPPAPTSTPRPVSTPRPTATPTPGTLPTPHAGLNYYLLPLVPIAPFEVGTSLKYADGTEFSMTVRTSGGEYQCVIVRTK